MSINPFSFLMILLIGGLFIKNIRQPIEVHIKYLFIITVFRSLFFNVGYFLGIGSTHIAYSFVPSFLLFVLCIIYILTNGHFSGRLIILGILFWTFVSFGVIHSVLSPYRYGVIQNSWDAYVMGEEELSYSPVLSLSPTILFGLIRFPFILAVVYHIFKKDDYLRALGIAGVLTNVIVIYGFIELLAKFVFKIDMTETFLNPIFGEEPPTLSGTDRLQGLFKEPSHYAQGLLYLSVLNLFGLRMTQDRRGRYWGYFRFVGLLLLLIASTSFSALFYAIVIVALYLVVCHGVRVRYIVGIGGCLAVLAVLLCMDDGFMHALGLGDLHGRIDRVFRSLGDLFAGQKGTPSSEGARFSSIYSMIEILRHRPLFGIGIGVTDASSTLFAVLGNTGLLGCAVWIYILLYFGRIGKRGAYFACLFFLCMALVGGIGYLDDLGFPFIFACAGIAFSEPLPVKRRVRAPIRGEVTA